MKLEYLFRIQKIIDEEIRVVYRPPDQELDRQHLVKTKILGLEVKTGQLANLVKAYKYPNLVSRPEKWKLLYRYLDCFKYLLSIGNDNHFNIVNFELDELLRGLSEDANRTILDLFLALFDSITNLKRDLVHDNYISGINVYIAIFKEFVLLGYLLGLTYEDVFSYYDRVYRAIRSRRAAAGIV